MGNWTELSKQLENILRLRTKVIAFRKLDDSTELDKIPDVFRINHLFTFCEVPAMVRVQGLTVGITRQDSMLGRCARIHGLKTASDKSMNSEANDLATTWLASPEEGLEQQADYPRIPTGEAIILAPLEEEKFEPEVLLVYANPAQIMMLMCGLQKEKYERFNFSFIGEGACSESLAQCYVTGKPALAIPCYGERAFGQVTDDEIVIALPPAYLERTISGMNKLAEIGFKYPIGFLGCGGDPTSMLARWYPQYFKS